MSLQVGQFSSRWMMRLFPFASKRVIVDKDEESYKNPQPSIWVCNHISLLDIFFVLALDKQMRGKNRRPIKILYWKGLESNLVTRALFKMCGFIPVEMADNGNGVANEYDPKSFREMLKSVKAAINEGFDIGLLPEGQPNPKPEEGLQPVFSGAYTLAKMSKRPIQMMALYGLNHMWHPNGSMPCNSRDMVVRVYPNAKTFRSTDEFTATFEAVVGYFGANGKDLTDKYLKLWLDGSMWETELSRRAAANVNAEKIGKKEDDINMIAGEDKKEVSEVQKH
jgi:1-acyl-sn-glycerol-3-phosphate acyltransferase